MKRNRVLAAVAVVFSLLALGNVASAVAAKKQNHHDAHRLVAGKIKADGHHDIDKKGHYTASVESKGGKIAAFHVAHDTKGQIPVKKYKTNKKMAKANGSHLTYASFALPQDTDMGTCTSVIPISMMTGTKKSTGSRQRRFWMATPGQSSTFR